MKQLEDDKTIDMLDPAKKRPGRPRSQKPKADAKEQAAKRQAARRARLREGGKGMFSAVVDAALLQRIDEIHASTGAEKNTIVEDLLRRALDMQTA